MMFSENDLDAGWETGVIDPTYGAGAGNADLLNDFFASVTDVGSDWARLYLDDKYRDNTIYGADQYGAYPVGVPVNRSFSGFFKDNAVLMLGGAIAGLILWKVL